MTRFAIGFRKRWRRAPQTGKVGHTRLHPQVANLTKVTTQYRSAFHEHTETAATTKMAANVGLSTPRGSGTSGYVQSNKAHLRTQNNRSEPYPKDVDTLKHKQRQPDKDILEHDRKREIEVKVFELRDQLEDEE